VCVCVCVYIYIYIYIVLPEYGHLFIERSIVNIFLSIVCVYIYIYSVT